MTMTVSVENWAEQVRAGDVRAISRAVSAIENREPQAEEILRQLFRTPAKPIASASLARRARARARSWTASQAAIVTRKKPLASSRWIPRAPSRAVRFSATASACKATHGHRSLHSLHGHARISGGLSQATANDAAPRRGWERNHPRGDSRRRPGRNRNRTPRRLHDSRPDARNGRRRAKPESRPDGNRRHLRPQ